MPWDRLQRSGLRGALNIFRSKGLGREQAPTEEGKERTLREGKQEKRVIKRSHIQLYQRLLQCQLRQKCEMEVRISSVPVKDALSWSWVVGVEAEPHWQGAHSPETLWQQWEDFQTTRWTRLIRLSCFLFMIASLLFYSDYQSRMCSL